MKRPLVTILAASAAGLAALTIALPGVAAAYPSDSGSVPGGGAVPGPGPGTGPGGDPYNCDGDALRRAQAAADPQVESYLSVHPDLGAEIVRLHKLPQSQQVADWQAYSRAHPQEASDYQGALQSIHDFHQMCDGDTRFNRSSDQSVPGY